MNFVKRFDLYADLLDNVRRTMEYRMLGPRTVFNEHQFVTWFLNEDAN